MSELFVKFCLDDVGNCFLSKLLDWLPEENMVLVIKDQKYIVRSIDRDVTDTFFVTCEAVQMYEHGFAERTIE